MHYIPRQNGRGERKKRRKRERRKERERERRGRDEKKGEGRKEKREKICRLSHGGRNLKAV